MKELKINVPEGYEIDKDKSTFDNIVFKKNVKLPKSWDELDTVDGFRINGDEVVSPGMIYLRNDKATTFKTREQAGAALALAKLSHLRDVYREGWEPDWNDSEQIKYAVDFDYCPSIVFVLSCIGFLSFQDKETAELFLENFRDLIEQAKPLMS